MPERLNGPFVGQLIPGDRVITHKPFRRGVVKEQRRTADSLRGVECRVEFDDGFIEWVDERDLTLTERPEEKA